MSSRAHQKAAARRQREHAVAAEQRRRNLATLAAVAVAALALVAIVIAVSRSGAEEPPAAAAVQPAAPTARFAGIPQDGIVLGSSSAPATLVEYADLQCPYCGVYGREVLPSVVDKYVRPGHLKLESHVLTFLGEDSVRAGRMAAAAALQNRLWDFTDAFYAVQGEENSGYVTDEFLTEVGTAARVDVDAARAAQDGSHAERVLRDAQETAERLGVQGTPAFYVRRGKGEPQPLEFDELTPEAFAAAIDDALAAR